MHNFILSLQFTRFFLFFQLFWVSIFLLLEKKLSKDFNYHQLNHMKCVRGWCGFPFFLDISLLIDSFSLTFFVSVCLYNLWCSTDKSCRCAWPLDLDKFKLLNAGAPFRSNVQNKLNDLLDLLTPLNTYYSTFHSLCDSFVFTAEYVSVTMHVSFDWMELLSVRRNTRSKHSLRCRCAYYTP